MIKLNRDRTRVPAAYRGAKLKAKLQALVLARMQHGEKIEFEGVIGDWSKTKARLKAESFGKCAYCESDTEKVAYGDVEHFRPKSIYWWLALCMDNYNFSCQICNQGYKSNHSSVQGARLTGPALPASLPGEPALTQLLETISPDPALVTDAELLSNWFNEDSDLPNPYLEDPEPLLAWAVSNTNQEVHLVAPYRGSARANRAVQACIDHLGLNREVLMRSRYVAYRDLLFALQVWRGGDPDLSPLAAAEVVRLCAQEMEYAGMRRFFARAAGFAI